jgi:hypothetical protein
MVHASSTVVLSWKSGRLVALGLAVINERIGDDRKNADENDDDHPQQERVQLVDAASNSGDRLLQIEFPGGVRSATEQAEQSRNEQPGGSTSQTIAVAIAV